MGQGGEVRGHQAAVKEYRGKFRLHPADVIAHNEENVGFLLLLRDCWHARHHANAEKREQSEP